MAITFGQAKKYLAQWAEQGGKCDSDPVVEFFVREVLEYMLISGNYGNVRKFTFNAIKGVFTAPYELEAPLKIRINGQIGQSWDKWFEYYTDTALNDCLPQNAMFEDPNRYPIVYDVPDGGAFIATLGTSCEDSDAHIIVKGTDLSGRDVVTYHEGKQIVGEYIGIKEGLIVTTQVKFGKITEVTKTKTNGYVQLLWVNSVGERGFLSDYAPYEQLPSYRRFKIQTRCADSVEVSVLGRIRLKEYYADDDLIFVDTLYSLRMAAQAINSSYNDDIQTAQAKDTMLQSLITRENESKRVQTGQPVDMAKTMSGGSIQNIVGNGYWNGMGRLRRGGY